MKTTHCCSQLVWFRTFDLVGISSSFAGLVMWASTATSSFPSRLWLISFWLWFSGFGLSWALVQQLGAQLWSCLAVVSFPPCVCTSGSASLFSVQLALLSVFGQVLAACCFLFVVGCCHLVLAADGGGDLGGYR
jgi:hypothetical protein